MRHCSRWNTKLQKVIRFFGPQCEIGWRNVNFIYAQNAVKADIGRWKQLKITRQFNQAQLCCWQNIADIFANIVNIDVWVHVNHVI